MICEFIKKLCKTILSNFKDVSRDNRMKDEVFNLQINFTNPNSQSSVMAEQLRYELEQLLGQKVDTKVVEPPPNSQTSPFIEMLTLAGVLINMSAVILNLAIFLENKHQAKQSQSQRRKLVLKFDDYEKVINGLTEEEVQKIIEDFKAKKIRKMLLESKPLG